MQVPTYTTLGHAGSSRTSGPMPLWKVAVDVLCCLPALPVLAVLTLVMAIVTRIVSPGPVFFRQERIGYRGRRFNILKFRTMKVGASTTVHEEYVRKTIRSAAPMQKLDASGDPRLIPFGWLLRASGIDELPQIVNVLLGDMSIVGPRPCTPEEFGEYRPGQRERVNAMPGLTGLWQVSGKNRTTFDEMIHLDIQYARTFGLLLDVKIMLLTPWALAVQILDTGRGRKAAQARTAEIVQFPSALTRRHEAEAAALESTAPFAIADEETGPKAQNLASA